MITLLQIVFWGFVLATAYEVGKYMGHRDAEKLFRDRSN